MYNFLVSFSVGAWDQPAYEYDRSRFREYTDESLKRKFEKPTPRNIEQMKAFPALFAYEGTDRLRGWAICVASPCAGTAW